MNNLTLNAYQAEMSVTAIYRWPLIYPALGLANEAGEVLGKIKKLIRDSDVTFGSGGNTITDKQRAEIAAELGDVLWYVTIMASNEGSSLSEIMKINYNKLEQRALNGKK